MRRCLLIAMVLSASALFAERPPFERYQSIVDRQMFGQPPEGFDPTKPPSEVSAKEEKSKDEARAKEEEKIKSAIRFSAINLTPEGATAVGFTDSSDPKNPVNYYLKVGESRNGWTVKEADAIKATMTIAKDDIEVELALGADSSKGGARKAGTGAAAPLTRGGMRGAMRGGSEALNSIRLRRAQRKQKEAEMAAAEKAATEAREQARAQREAAEKAEREQEKAAQAAEREENRKQLLAIQEELRKAREAKKVQEADEESQEPKDE